MKTFLKVMGGVVLAAFAIVAFGVGWLTVRKPAQRPASAERIEATPERIARGKYLVHHVTDCLGCHSDHTLAYALPIKPARRISVRAGVRRAGTRLRAEHHARS